MTQLTVAVNAWTPSEFDYVDTLLITLVKKDAERIMAVRALLAANKHLDLDKIQFDFFNVRAINLSDEVDELPEDTPSDHIISMLGAYYHQTTEDREPFILPEIDLDELGLNENSISVVKIVVSDEGFRVRCADANEYEVLGQWIDFDLLAGLLKSEAA